MEGARLGRLALLCLMVLAIAHGNPEARVVWFDRSLAVDPGAVRLGDECWLPIIHAEKAKLTAKLVDNGSAVLIGNRKYAARVLAVPESSGQEIKIACLPLREALKDQGVSTVWDGSELKCFATLTSIEVSDGKLKATTSLPVESNAFLVRNPDRLVIDFKGCRLPDKEIEIATEFKVRTGQFAIDTARIVVELTGAAPNQPPIRARGTERIVALPTTVAVAEVTVVETDPTEFAPILPVVENADGSAWVRMPLNAGQKPKFAFGESPEQVSVEIGPLTLAEAVRQEFSDPNGLVRAISMAPGSAGTGRLIVELSRAAAVRFLPGAQDVSLHFTVPRNAGGKMRDKIVTIDPGHGGGQPGAKAVHQGKTVFEKDITLNIASKAAQRLGHTGASILMTRAGDRDVGLYERTTLSNDSGAHFFISVHADSTPRPNSASGTTIYYHKDDADSRALAQAILKEIVAVSGLPSRGVRSDSVLYQSGLAVLRTSSVPAVLIEVGYINHDGDRAKLVDPKFQDKIADAIARGVRKYVGDD